MYKGIDSLPRDLATSYNTWPLYYDEWHLQRVHCCKTSLKHRRSRHSVTFNLINFHCLVNMTSQQEDLHIDVGCYSPPTATDATIIGTNGAQPTGEYAGLDPLWVCYIWTTSWHIKKWFTEKVWWFQQSPCVKYNPGVHLSPFLNSGKAYSFGLS